MTRGVDRPCQSHPRPVRRRESARLRARLSTRVPSPSRNCPRRHQRQVIHVIVWFRARVGRAGLRRLSGKGSTYTEATRCRGGSQGGPEDAERSPYRAQTGPRARPARPGRSPPSLGVRGYPPIAGARRRSSSGVRARLHRLAAQRGGVLHPVRVRGHRVGLLQATGSASSPRAQLDADVRAPGGRLVDYRVSTSVETRRSVARQERAARSACVRIDAIDPDSTYATPTPSREARWRSRNSQVQVARVRLAPWSIDTSAVAA